MSKTRGGLVYSTEHGRSCPGCGRPQSDCSCRSAVSGPPRKGVVRVGRETKHRRGKGVTVMTGVPLPAAKLAALAKRLKQTCGSGGTVKDGVIEIQGDHRERVARELEAHGWEVKRSGG